MVLVPLPCPYTRHRVVTAPQQGLVSNPHPLRLQLALPPTHQANIAPLQNPPSSNTVSQRREEASLNVPAPDPGQIGQLLHYDGAVVEGGLELLGNSVSNEHGQDDGQDVGNLPRDLKDQQGGGNGVSDGA